MNIDLAVVARDLRLPPEKIERSVQLLDEGNTIPFITRFRKDQTGGLNEEQLLAIKQRVASLRSLAERKAFVVKSIESQSKLTDDLAQEIEKANTSRRLEDLYHPFKAKKQSRAQTARHQGLEPLADEIFAGTTPDVDMSTRATDYVRVDKGLTSVDEVIKGVGDLLAEKFSEDSELRSKLRKILWETGSLVSQSATPTPTASKPKSKNPSNKTAAEKTAAEKTTAEKTTDGESAKTESTDKESVATEVTASADAAKPDAAKPEAQMVDAAATVQAPAETTPPATPTPSETAAEAQTTEPPDTASPTPPAEIDKTTHKMSAGENEASGLPDSDAAAKKEPLKAVEPAKEPPKVVTDPAAQPSVVADAAKEKTKPSAESKPSAETKPAAESKPTTETKPSAESKSTTETKPSSDEPISATPPAAAKPAADTTAAKPAAKKKRKKKKKKKKDDTAFKDYYDFKQKLKSLPHHQVLAINRGERSNRLKVKIAYDEQKVLETASEHLIPEDHPNKPFLQKCVQDALTRLVIPSLEREIRRELNENSEKHAVGVFASNLKNLLLTPPLRGRRVMAIDPGFKSGCSVAILDNQGQFVASSHLFVVGNKERREESCKKVATLVKEHNVDMIAIGNGVGCRETEQIVSDAISESLEDHPVRYVIVNEAGTSIYSTSEVGREELPDHTPAVRSAISIGRRLQNPISELVKISPANIGVGMYQHDVKAKHLSESLDEVVQFCVNRVGVDVNSASPSLLRFVSGMNALTARRVYEYCKENGGIKNRQQLKEVSGLGDATFIQAAGFLRIRDSDNPLDSTSIHPESYPIAEEIISRANSTPAELFAPRKPAKPPESAPAPPVAEATAQTPSSTETPATETPATETTAAEVPAADAPAPEKVEAEAPKSDVPKHTKRKEIIDRITALDLDAIAEEKQIGKMLMTDLVRAIKKPLWDPRDKISKPISRRGILKADDLKPEVQLDAQVVNVVDFGVFVDIGLGESCLVHVSQLSTRYISDPQMVYAVGDIMKVWVSEIDGERRRVKLTAIRPGTKKETGRGRRRKDSGRGDKQPNSDGRPAHARPAHARPAHAKPKFVRKTTQRRPPQKPKPVIPITDDMLKGEAPMRSFSDLLQFKKKSPDESKKNGES